MNNQSSRGFPTRRCVADNKLFIWLFCLSLIAIVGCSRRPAPSLSLPHDPPLVARLKTECGMVSMIQTQTGGVTKSRGLDLFKASPSALHTVGDAQWIEELDIEASDLSTPAFGEIGKLTRLKKLTLLNCQFVPEQLLAIQNLTNLEALELMFSIGDETTGSRAKMLGKLSSDEERTAELLKQKGCYEEIIQMALLTDRAMPFFDRMARLKKLEMDNTYFSATGFQHLASLTNLEEADIHPIGLTGETATPFLAMTKLRSLRYFNANDGVISVVSKLRDLEYLDVWSGDVTDASASKLADLRKLQRLEIRGNKMTDDGLQRLQQLSNLSFLDLKSAKNITAHGIDEFAGVQPGTVVDH